jgi:hypothetical protein
MKESSFVTNVIRKSSEEDGMALIEERKGFLYLLLKTVVDVLDQKGMGS